MNSSHDSLLSDQPFLVALKRLDESDLEQYEVHFPTGSNAGLAASLLLTAVGDTRCSDENEPTSGQWNARRDDGGVHPQQ
jgi:hypothetical protein